MARFETPIKNPELRAKADGLDEEAIDIAHDLSRALKVLMFVQAYVAPPTLEVEKFGAYDRVSVSALGDNGSLVHVRSHADFHLTVPDRSYISVISHVDDPGEPRLDTAQDVGASYATNLHTYVIGSVNGTPREVGKELSADEELAQLLHQRRAHKRRPEIRTDGGVKWYKRSDGVWERLTVDLKTLAEHVQETTRRGIGDTVLASIVREADKNGGQYDENVLGLQHATQ